MREVKSVKKTNTRQITVTADVTQDIVISVSGTQLLHDNSDAMDRCKEIALFSQIADKDQLMRLAYSSLPVQEKLWHMEGSRREWMPISDALRELLTLTEEEF